MRNEDLCVLSCAFCVGVAREKPERKGISVMWEDGKRREGEEKTDSCRGSFFMCRRSSEEKGKTSLSSFFSRPRLCVACMSLTVYTSGEKKIFFVP
jgi:hypothetical protein